ncbi:GNAT family N-acetyltransferase [Paenibacillus sp. WQ 127069]|uniref:GNAT family N-acetyltransferase n=1 Tax=Paenibacillus baimaensis TaxID=2982185 RepID=A0ABT2US84_9BACL|nr:GNAT family N-acetyltransferase [Paenibacillus sp. WQ 127069]MCU6797530.1 GNAT family N-acetyltransferase [Paenibacillus sp. WQ 127069]
MDFVRITSIEDPNFLLMHELMKKVFPPEEVLEYSLWREPLEDPGIRVFVAVHKGAVVGATEYRYYDDLQVAMTDFTIIGQAGLGIGRFMAAKRMADLQQQAALSGRSMLGMFAEIYDPYRIDGHEFGGIKPMDPYVRREVLSHLGYQRLELDYVHPSWENNGEAVEVLDLCFMPIDDSCTEVSASLIVQFLTRYYSVLPDKPLQWQQMIEGLKQRDTVALFPL